MTRLTANAAVLACAAAVPALCLVAVVSAHGGPHPLDLVNTAAIRWPGDATYSRADRTAAATVTVDATPKELKTNGDWVDVTWSGVAHPKATDFLAVYSPAGVDVHSIAPVKWLQLGQVHGYTESGAGKWRFRILNLRATVSFVLYTGSFDKPVYAAQSDAVHFRNVNEPLGLHLALAHTSPHNQTLAVSWSSGTRGTRPRVQFGTTPNPGGADWREVDANRTSTYTHDDLCGEPATSRGWLPQGVGFFHHAFLDALVPTTTYYYRVGDDRADDNGTDDGGWSDVHSFVAPPPVGHPVSLFAFGDLGQTQVDGSLNFHGSAFHHSRATTDQIAKVLAANPNADGSGYAAVMHIGDLAYARGYASEWPNFHDQTQSTAAQLPWMVCIGNHERDWPHSGSSYDGTDSGGECGVPYLHRFAMPLPDMSAVTSPRPSPLPRALPLSLPGRVVDDTPWYSLNFGAVHWCFMSTEHDYKAGSAQHQWIVHDLTHVDRAVTPYVVFLGHRPMYFAADGLDDATADADTQRKHAAAQGLKEALEEVLYSNGVDLALWGHVHTYQRACPVYKDACHPVEANAPERAPVHLVIGHAGAGLVPVPKAPAKFWEFVDTTHYGFISLEVRADQMTVRALTSDEGAVVDSVVIPRNKHWA